MRKTKTKEWQYINTIKMEIADMVYLEKRRAYVNLNTQKCNKLLKHGTNSTLGCNKGKNCEEYHPKMCFSSLKSRICHATHCKFVHVKGTKRITDDIKIPSKHQNKNKMNNQRNDIDNNNIINNSNNSNNNSNNNNAENILQSLHCLVQSVEAKMEKKRKNIVNMISGIKYQPQHLHQPQQPHQPQHPINRVKYQQIIPPQWKLPYNPTIQTIHPNQPIYQYK